MTDSRKGRGAPELHPKTASSSPFTTTIPKTPPTALPSGAPASNQLNGRAYDRADHAEERPSADTGTGVTNYAEAPLSAFMDGDLWADPALAVGLVFQFWRIGVGTGCRIPRPLQAVLHEHVRRGDPVCAIVHRQCVWDGLADPVPSDSHLEDGGQTDA